MDGEPTLNEFDFYLSLVNEKWLIDAILMTDCLGNRRAELLNLCYCVVYCNSPSKSISCFAFDHD